MVLVKEPELLGQLDLRNPIQLPIARHNISINLYSREVIMLRKCVVCGKIMGEVGDKKNGSFTSGICDKCMIAIEQYRYYKRMYKTTGFDEYQELIDKALKGLTEKERINSLNKQYERR